MGRAVPPPAAWARTGGAGGLAWAEDGGSSVASVPPCPLESDFAVSCAGECGLGRWDEKGQFCSAILRSALLEASPLSGWETSGHAHSGSAGGGGGPGSPGDVPEWRGQAGQMEGPGTAVTADELPTVPAHGALVLVLLTQSGDRHPLRDPGWAPSRPDVPHQAAPRAASPRGTQVPSLLPAWNSALPACSPGLREAPLSETVAPNTSWVHPPREGLSLGEPGVSWVPVLHAAVRLQPTPHSPFLTEQRRGRPSSVPPTPCLCPLCLRPSLEGAYCTQLDATSFRSPPG